MKEKISYIYLTTNLINKNFQHSNSLIDNKIKPSINKLTLYNKATDNQKIDSYIQSPLEYVNEILQGNQVPTFVPDDYYQDAMYKSNIKYIVAITAENPNLFLDPTIGFYMSNCYAVSLIRHVNDYFMNTPCEPNSIPKLEVVQLNDFEEAIDKRRQEIIDFLKENDEVKLNDFEFIRFFIYDKNQKDSCANAVFPSLKASQDLFRTFSFFIQKEDLVEKLSNEPWEALEVYEKLGEEKNKWERLKVINTKIYHLYDNICKGNKIKENVQNERIKNTIPEYLFIFYDNKIEIHSYFGGGYRKIPPVGLNDTHGKIIKELIKMLAEYVDKDESKGQLNIDGTQINKNNTFINWKWSIPPKKKCSSLEEQNRVKKLEEEVERRRKQNEEYKQDPSQNIKFVIKNVEFNMIHVKVGPFVMGATSEQLKNPKNVEDDEMPAHIVTLTNDYWIGEKPVTQDLWKAVMGYNRSYFAKKGGKNNKCPVETVTWSDCQEFIAELNRQAENQLQDMEFCFPTEAEWEFAARGGINSGGYIYAGSDDPDVVAWYNDTKTHSVEKPKKANELGLYDMCGNVWEWCKDRYGKYHEGELKNPEGPKDEKEKRRVARGGSSHCEYQKCRVSSRGYGNINHAGNGLGLRLALKKKETKT